MFFYKSLDFFYSFKTYLFRNFWLLRGAPTAIIRSKASKTTENREAYMNIKEVYVKTLQPYRPNGHSPLLNRSIQIVSPLSSKNPSEKDKVNSIKYVRMKKVMI